MKYLSSFSKNGKSISFKNIVSINGKSISPLNRSIEAIILNGETITTKNRITPPQVAITVANGGVNITNSENSFDETTQTLTLTNFSSHASYDEETGNLTFINS